MTKLDLNPEFTGETEVKEPKEELLEEATSEEEKETPEESSTLEKPDEEVIEKPKIVDDSEKEREIQGLEKELGELGKDTYGLDEKISDLRQRIVDKRTERREKREITKEIETIVPEGDTLEDIDPESKKIVERVLKAKGYVPLSELDKRTYQSGHKKAEKEFFNKHPEYLPDNDPNDTLYNALKNELADFVQPSDSDKIPTLFEKAHKQVVEKYPTRFKVQNSTSDAVKQERLKKAGLGGGPGSGAASSSKDSKITQKQVEILRMSGWSEDDIKELM